MCIRDRHAIVPGAFLSDNFDITYSLGNLTIQPATLTVKADDKQSTYGSAPAFTSEVSGFQYDDDEASVVAGSPGYTLLDGSNAAVNGNIPAGTFSIVPGNLPLVQPTNYIVSYEDGTLNVGKATLQATADNKTREYGTDNPAFNIIYSGFLYSDDSTSITQPVASTTATSSTGVGTYPITLSGGASDNYNFVLLDGTLTITKALLTVTADNQNRTYGASNPPLTISYSGLKGIDGPSSVSGLTIATTATPASVIGNYPITLSGGSSANYTIAKINGTLTINKATLVVRADNKVINKGSSLPTFTATYTSFYNGDQSTITCGPTFTLSPSCVGNAGVYTITPSNLSFTKSNNYIISFVTGTLYINPKGSGAKKILPSLVCVDTLIGHASGFPYVAHWKYVNTNSTPVFVTRGTDNSLTSSASYSGQQPELFNVGTGYFDIYFNGTSMTWTVKTYEGNTKTTVTAVSYTHLRAHETVLDLVCRLLLEKKKSTTIIIHQNH